MKEEFNTYNKNINAYDDKINVWLRCSAAILEMKLIRLDMNCI